MTGSMVGQQPHFPDRPVVTEQGRGEVSWPGQVAGCRHTGSAAQADTQDKTRSLNRAHKQKRETTNKAFNSTFPHGSSPSSLAAAQRSEPCAQPADPQGGWRGAARGLDADLRGSWLCLEEVASGSCAFFSCILAHIN